MLDGFAAAAVYVSLHTADPGTTGTSEVSGGSPAYARKVFTWAASGGGSKASSSATVHDVPASTTITHAGYWSAASGGTFYGWRALDTNQTFSTQGTYTVAIGNISESI